MPQKELDLENEWLLEYSWMKHVSKCLDQIQLNYLANRRIEVIEKWDMYHLLNKKIEAFSQIYTLFFGFTFVPLKIM